jgi:NADPH2:quinone reductase
MMFAAFYERTGPAADVLQLGELPTPQPGPGEVRVRLATSGVNPSDVKTRGGYRSRELPFARIVPHSDGAGTIDAVGPDVPERRVGERVWTWNAAWQRPMGTAAQFVVLPAAQAVALPAGTDFAAGACLGIPALTALHALRVDGDVAGQTVLVAGGAGAVGHYAVQMARLLGAARVIATAGSAATAEIARAAGAHEVIDYRREDVAARVAALTGGRGVDRVVEVDFAANAAVDLAAVRPEGRIVVYGSGQRSMAVPFAPAIVKNVPVRFMMVYTIGAGDRAAALGQLGAWLDAGVLRHRVGVRLPLAQIARAHQIVEAGGSPGNVVLEIA